MKRLTTNWYEDFSCIGGACPYSCCSSSWRIEISEEEYRQYQALDHPFRDEILKSIEGEPGRRRFAHCNGRCALLTEDGWCRMVQECGFEIQTAVCRDFPRSIVSYGDIEECSTEIACPVLAERLMTDNEPIAIREQEISNPTDRKRQGIPLIYEALLPSRSLLLDLLQIGDSQFAYGKIYLIYSLLFRLRSLAETDSLTPQQGELVTDGFRSEELIEAALLQDAALRSNWPRRIMAAVNALTIEDAIDFSGAGDRLFPDDRAWAYLKELRADRSRLEADLRPFLSEIEETWPNMLSNFLSYIVFLDWIQTDLSKFGERMICRAFEYTMFILLGMAEKKVYGALTKERWIRIISWTDRTVIHNAHLPRIVLHTLEQSGSADGAGILTILV